MWNISGLSFVFVAHLSSLLMLSSWSISQAQEFEFYSDLAEQ